MTHRRPHILFIASWYPNKQQPLNGNFVRNHAESVGLYCNVTVLHVFSDPDMSEIKTDLTLHGNVQEIRIRYPKVENNMPVLPGFVKYFRIKKALQQTFSEHKAIFDTVDLVHYHVLTPMCVFYDFIQNQINKPTLVTEHSTHFTYLDSYKYSALELYFAKKAIKKSLLTTTVSGILEDSLKELVPEAAYKIIPNVVDTNRFGLNLKQNSPDDKKVILHISNLTDRHKNISGLLRTVQELSKKRSDFELHIVGDGDDREYLTSLAENSGMLNKTVFFLGELTDEVLVSAFQKCRFLSLFSHFETFGVVLIEALASGKPVVASDLPCIREFIGKEQGLLVKPGDERELLLAFEFMLDENNYHRFDPEQLHNHAQTNFSYEAVGKIFLEEYQTILSQNSI